MIASNEERSKVRIPKSHLRRCVPQLTLLDAASVAFGPRSILSDPEIPAPIPRPRGHPINSSHSQKPSWFGANLGDINLCLLLPVAQLAGDGSGQFEFG